jgi:peptidoglycan/LPS O-acetylase OafA/YrhL
MSMAPAVKHSSLKHRPDIDGLRAVAVLAVIFYHLGLPVHGGYVGVDVFFVISGFLISSIILAQIKSGTFTFAGFYERRLRRIFPAMFAMLAATCVLAYVYLLPVETEEFGKSLLSADFSASNFFFWLNSGYFDTAASSKPLLHTWSLAVEEQFYIGLPVLFWFLKRYAPKWIDASVIAVALGSFALSVVGAYRYPTAAFYLAPYRAWELMLGGVVSLDSLPNIRSALLREITGIAGLGLILASSLFYRTTTVFPGLAALAPCGGTALIIAAGRGGPSLVGRLLSLKPVTFVGLISYSLYLWHWPIIVFHNFGMTIVPGLVRRQAEALLFIVIFISGVLSWRFVEEPFRVGGRLRLSRSTVFRLALAGLGTLAIIGSSALVSSGLPRRFSSEAQQVARYLDRKDTDEQYRTGTCFMIGRDWDWERFNFNDCLPTDAKKRSLLILGDSQAAHLWWGMGLTFPELNVMQATSAGCKPVLEQRPRQFPGCTRLMRYMLTQYVPSHPTDTVLLSARWDADDLPTLSQTLGWLESQQIHAVLVGPMVQYDAPLPRLLAMSIRQNDPILPGLHRATFVSPLDTTMAEAARSQWRVPYISMVDLLCAGENCVQYAGPGIPLLSDYGHLTKEGSVMVARKLREQGKLQ